MTDEEAKKLSDRIRSNLKGGGQSPDPEDLAERMGAKYKGKVEAGHGYFGALQTAANVRNQKMSTVLDRFFELEQDQYGKAKYWFKRDRLVSKIKAFYVRPFNPRYLTHVTTTSGQDTAFPENYRNDPQRAVLTEFHENVHKFDWRLFGIGFPLGYAYPQIVAVPFVLAAAGLAGAWGWLGLGLFLFLLHLGLLQLHASSFAGREVPGKTSRAMFFGVAGIGCGSFILACIYGGGYWASLLLGAALFISPWPFKARWRRGAEIRGYTMTLYRKWLAGETITDKLIWEYAKYFTGSAYFYMETNASVVSRELQHQVRTFVENEGGFLEYWQWGGEARTCVAMAEPFRMVRTFMEQEGMIRVS